MSELRLLETIHPTKEGEHDFEALFGIDAIKESLADELALILDRKRLDDWGKRHHSGGLGILNITKGTLPLILLSGDVGCGKTALASCIATPVARAIDQRIVCLETPSDIRGGGHVGELSSRVTDAFTQAKSRAAAVGRAILVIDEADDLATGRSQMQAHHEDRAGVNVLIKQINQLSASPAPIALIMITNRPDVLDPAVLRRAALRLNFQRPNEAARFAVFQRLLHGTSTTETQLQELVKLTVKKPQYTFSDLTDRIARLALRRCWKANQPFGVAALKAAIAEIEPSPLMAAS
ncbi:ATP-binding protein [Bradyrhizobium sp.]|uniref:AAA family ATPase n=1 Tax=Bradyrhizobium sp. TaxID=376 RepID=UPI0025C64101|nr:ATP-binding protein [Bradyrhizobium sp.]